jgi:curved DNA-binding protein CbpA
LSYLLYTVYEAYWNLSLEPDFYQLLGIPHNVSDAAIRSKMRKMYVVGSSVSHLGTRANWKLSNSAQQLHPDKVAPDLRSFAEATFHATKTASETLSDPIKRFAYDRLGPVILDPQSAYHKHACQTYGDYISTAITSSILPSYLTTVASMALLMFLNFLPHGKYWRWVVVAGMATFEWTTITRPYFPPILTYIVNPLLVHVVGKPALLPFQLIQIARAISISFFIAMNQIAPQLKGPAVDKDSDAAVQMQLNAQTQLVAALGDRVNRMWEFDVAPFKNSEKPDESLQRLKEQTKQWMIRNTILQDQGVKTAIENALGRRQAAAAGAGADGLAPEPEPAAELETES